MSDDPAGRDYPAEPTSDQCDLHAPVGFFHERPSYACWYPQMGGYVGKCVVVLGYESDFGSCFEAYVWHDGEFPFTGDYVRTDDPNRRRPVLIHHCTARQFIEFGEFVTALLEGEGDHVVETGTVGSGEQAQGSVQTE